MMDLISAEQNRKYLEKQNFDGEEKKEDAGAGCGTEKGMRGGVKVVKVQARSG